MRSENRLPRLVLFDLGNVLVSLRPLHLAFPLEELLAGPGVTRDELHRELTAFMRSEIFDRFERGLAAQEEFFGAMRARFPTRLSDSELEACYSRILGDEVEGMAEVVDEVKRAGIRVAGLTDTSPVHLRMLSRYPAVRALEMVIASCVTGRRKPDPETFREALRRLRVGAEDVYYTDDVPANVEGARRAGIRSDVFQGPASVRRALGLGERA